MSKTHTYAALVCKHCNAHLRVDLENPTITCEYCGATYRTSDLFPASAPESSSNSEPEVPREPARGRGYTPEQKKRRIITVLVVLALTFLCVRCSVTVVSDGSQSSSTASSSTVVSPSASTSTSGDAMSSSATSNDAFGGTSSSSASSGSSNAGGSGSAGNSNSNSSSTITPATHSNPDAVNPEIKQQLESFEKNLIKCIGEISTGKFLPGTYLELLSDVEELGNLLESSDLTSADKQYARETLVHIMNNLPGFIDTEFKSAFTDSFKNFLTN